MISEHILLTYQARISKISKGEFVFKEGQYARNYYQIKSGELKMNNYTEDGNEFIQGIFKAGESFGEPPLFGDFNYPANAQVLSDCEVISLTKEQFFKLLVENPEVHLKVSTSLASRLFYKAKMAVEISNHQASHRIITLLEYLKERTNTEEKLFSYEVELTRKQIGDLTGLRTETVIRAMKVLEKEGKIKIENRKVFR